MEGTSAVQKVIGVIPDLFDLSTQCFNQVLENPLLLVFFGVSMIGVGLGIFSMLKNTAKG